MSFSEFMHLLGGFGSGVGCVLSVLVIVALARRDRHDQLGPRKGGNR